MFEDQRLFAKAADVLGPAVTRFSAEAEPPRELLTLIAHLGFAELQAGRAEAAIETFERARTLSGGAGGFDTSLIQAYLLARKYDQAADLARAARQRRPTELRLAQLEARALSKAGRKDRAVVVMRDAVAEHADDVQAHLTLAEILQDAARADEADRVLDQAAERFPSEISVPFQRGALLEQRKDYPRAEAAFRQALARDPLHAPSLNYLGYMLAERGDGSTRPSRWSSARWRSIPTTARISTAWAGRCSSRRKSRRPSRCCAAPPSRRRTTPSCRITSATCCGRPASGPRPWRRGSSRSAAIATRSTRRPSRRRLRAPGRRA